ncbi:MAG: CHASE2 domain-containing protein [Gammaproteobacteria bacterium]
MLAERQKQMLIAVVTGGCVWLLLVAARAGGFVQGLELLAYDLTLATRVRVVDRRPPVVTLVAITEADIRKLGRWPVTDRDLATALRALLGHEPRAIGLDIYRDLAVPPGNAQLAEVLANAQNLITVAKFGTGADEGVPPPPVNVGTNRVGYNDIVEDPDGVVRRALLFLDDGEQFGSTFALQLALRYLGADGIEMQPDPVISEHLRLGETTIRPLEANDGSYVDMDAGGYQFLLDYRTPAADFEVHSLDDVLNDRVPADALRDRIVILGSASESVKDSFATSLTGWRGIEAGKIPGIALHGQIADQLVRLAHHGDAPLKTLAGQVEVGLILAASLLGALLGLAIRSMRRLLLIGVGGIAAMLTLNALVFAAGYWLPIVPILLGWLLSSILVTGWLVQSEARDRALMMQLFSQHVSDQVAATIWERRQELLTEGRLIPQTLPTTILFADLADFTTASEQLHAEHLMDWLNDAMNKMSGLIIAHDGVVDDYFGDGIKANFGVPIARDRIEDQCRDARNAIDCALEMGRAISDLNDRCRARGYPVYGLRVGISSGSVVAGSLGSAERLKYTTVGDAVNTAARLETYGRNNTSIVPEGRYCRILISEPTLRLVSGEYRTRPLGPVTLKGKYQRVNVFEVYGAADSSMTARTADATEAQTNEKA